MVETAFVDVRLVKDATPIESRAIPLNRVAIVVKFMSLPDTMFENMVDRILGRAYLKGITAEDLRAYQALYDDCCAFREGRHK